MSHPVRVRGLKLKFGINISTFIVVAPRAGAWIETNMYLGMISEDFSVAPRAGAWIETTLHKLPYLTFVSHPVRVRGLKHFR